MSGFAIDWKKYTEEEIHLLICSLFTSLDYHIENRHRSDRANEDGADIVVWNDNENIAIAVKIKPKEKDRAQVIELSERSEKRKIYIYIDTPTDKFLKFTKSDQMRNVEFWDIKKLNDFFRESNPYFMANIIFESAELYSILNSLKLFLTSLWNENQHKKKEKPENLDKNSFKILWRLKDIAVMLNKSTQTIEPIFNQPLEFKDAKLDLHFIRVFNEYLDILARDARLFLEHFIAFKKEKPQLVSNGIITGLTTSHWFWIGEFKNHGNLEGIQQNLISSIMNKADIDYFKKKYPDEKREEKIAKLIEIASKKNSIWEGMACQIQKINLFGRALEIIIDDIVSEYVGSDTHLFKLNKSGDKQPLNTPKI